MSYEARRSTPDTLRALAHPLRMDILDRLELHGAMTASELGLELSESPANCSWHLRKLAEHNFVIEASGGAGRSRPWQLSGDRGSAASCATGASSGDARQLLAQVLVDREAARFAANCAREAEPPWADVNAANQVVLWLTAQEAQHVNARLTASLTRFRSRSEQPESRPTDARPVRLVTLISVDPAAANPTAAAVDGGVVEPQAMKSRRSLSSAALGLAPTIDLTTSPPL